MEDRNGDGTAPFLRSKIGIAFLVFLAAVAFLLVTEHRAHIYTGTGLLILLLIACIAVHVFMHRGQGNHDGGSGHGNRPGNSAAGE